MKILDTGLSVTGDVHIRAVHDVEWESSGTLAPRPRKYKLWILMVQVLLAKVQIFTQDGSNLTTSLFRIKWLTNTKFQTDKMGKSLLALSLHPENGKLYENIL